VSSRFNLTSLVLWGPVAVYMAAIFYASSLSVIPGPVGDWFSDTLLHMACYGGLALFVLRALAGGKWTGVTMGVAMAAWLIATLYGASDEWHQLYVPGRSSELRDLVNDAAGALAAVGVAVAWGIMRGPSRADARPPSGLSHDL
jgi:VanZ family protein